MEGWLWAQPPWPQSLLTCASHGRWWAGPQHCHCPPALCPHHHRWLPGGLRAPGGLHHGAWQCFLAARPAILLLPGLCHIFRLQIRRTRNVSAGYGQIWACTLEIREDKLTWMSGCSLGGTKMIARLGEHFERGEQHTRPCQLARGNSQGKRQALVQAWTAQGGELDGVFLDLRPFIPRVRE